MAARAAATSCAAVSGASSTFGHERLSSIAATRSSPSSRSQHRVKSAAEKPPTETQSWGTISARRGRWSATNASIPGPWRPIELSIPWSVSAIRVGGFPSRRSGVIVFVTNASRERATSGAASASRQPDALRIGMLIGAHPRR